jgi:branched-chain amino acid transport system ATP-binding protein
VERKIEKAMSQPLLQIVELVMRFGGLMAIDDLHVEIEEGGIYGLIGPNGAGKTTVFNCLSRFYDPQKGRVLFKGEEILRHPSHDIPRLGIARTFQNLELFGEMTTLENLLVAKHTFLRGGTLGGAFLTSRCRAEEKKIREDAEEKIDFLGLSQVKDEIVSSLPHGTQKLVELARALCLSPKLLLLDEPVSGMNPKEVQSIVENIRQINRQLGITVFLVEHNMSVVMGLCDQICVMDHGKRIVFGPPSSIQNDPLVIEAYLGRKKV